MNYGRRSSEKCAAATLTRNDETSAGSGQQDGWLLQAAARFRLAITLQIPVGYQDAAGFHYGQLPGHEPWQADDTAIRQF